MVVSDVFQLRDDIRARDFQAAVKSSGPEATARKVPAAVFLSRTFPTNDLVRLLKVVETKFTRREKELGVIVIRSGMGGGKSHLITALDVVLSNPGAAQEWAQKWPQVEFSPPPMPVRVIVRSLTEEPVENLWDCFFEGLGCPALKDDPTIVRQGHPDTALCEQALRDRPTLFVLDELEDWLAQWDQQKRRRNLEFLKQLVYYGRTYPNKFLLIEPSDNKFDLSDLTRPETQDLLDRARRVLACQKLLRDTPDTKENRAKRQTYERESQRALYGLRCLLHDAYGLWMRWPKLQFATASGDGGDGSEDA